MRVGGALRRAAERRGVLRREVWGLGERSGGLGEATMRAEKGGELFVLRRGYIGKSGALAYYEIIRKRSGEGRIFRRGNGNQADKAAIKSEKRIVKPTRRLSSPKNGSLSRK